MSNWLPQEHGPRLAFAGVILLGLTGLGFVTNTAHAPTQLFEPKPQGVSVLFVGDLMLDRNVARSAQGVGGRALFATSTLELFKTTDLRVANLEGTITSEPSIAQVNNKILRFTFSPSLAEEVLQLLNLSAVSLANNHALDFGEFGYEETVERLAAIGPKPFGQPFNDKWKLSTTLQARGKTVCLVGYHGLFAPDRSTVVDEILRIRPNCWRLVVVAHWGEEYEHEPTAAQRAGAYAFIDAGADLVIGAHPHVVEPVEVYRSKAIFYSLGNFMFDQNFSPETTRGLAVQVGFFEDKTTFTLVPMTISQQYSAVATGAIREAVLQEANSLAEFTLP